GVSARRQLVVNHTDSVKKDPTLSSWQVQGVAATQPSPSPPTPRPHRRPGWTTIPRRTTLRGGRGRGCGRRPRRLWGIPPPCDLPFVTVRDGPWVLSRRHDDQWTDGGAAAGVSGARGASAFPGRGRSAEDEPARPFGGRGRAGGDPGDPARRA